MSDLIDRQAAIKAIENLQDCYNGFSDTYDKAYIIGALEEVPSAQPDIAEKLYLYKCYITDQEGLQHEVIHTGDIRRVTGWMI